MENVASRRVGQCVKHAVDLLVGQSIYNHLVIGYVSYDQTLEGAAVSATVLYMSMSLDGFVAGPNEGPDYGLGDGGHRLHEWAMTGGGVDGLEATRRLGGVNGKVIDEFMTTTAAVRTQ
jgi:hypothetical protein